MGQRIIHELDIDYACNFIRSTSEKTSIYVGCDSKEEQRNKRTKFVTAIVAHIDSSKGGKCFFESLYIDRIMSLRERLLKEVYFAVNIALQIEEAVGERNLEVHIDVNENSEYASNIVLKEAKGYVTGQNFIVKSKPNSHAAFAVADYLVRN